MLQENRIPYFFVASAFVASAAGADFFAGFAGRLLPKEPLNIFPFFVFLSPLPIIITLNKDVNNFAGDERRLVSNTTGDERRGITYTGVQPPGTKDTKAPGSGTRRAKDPKISYARSRSFVYTGGCHGDENVRKGTSIQAVPKIIMQS